MEKKPLLQFYVDETWGYNIWDEETKKKEGISVKFQQEEDETREDFFKRLGLEPGANMYGSNLEMDKKVRDKNWYIRWTVAEQGYCLDVLVHDEDYEVRQAVAEQGFGLDILVNDGDNDVREEVARQGYCLDVLIDDKDKYVREAVARQGYGLDILVHDEDRDVRCAVEDYLQDYNYPSIEVWIEQNPKKVVDKKNRR